MNVVRVNSKNALAWTRLGLIASDKGDIPLAYQALVQAKKLQPENIVARSRLGRVYLSVGRLKDARSEALFVMDKDPLNAESILVLASSSRGEEVQDALQRIQKLPKEAAEKMTFHLARAYLHLGETNAPAAEAALSEHWELIREPPPPWLVWEIFIGGKRKSKRRTTPSGPPRN
jgi:cytochrome c-type biogenesis protein CcmH/NrfG